MAEVPEGRELARAMAQVFHTQEVVPTTGPWSQGEFWKSLVFSRAGVSATSRAVTASWAHAPAERREEQTRSSPHSGPLGPEQEARALVPIQAQRLGSQGLSHGGREHLAPVPAMGAGRGICGSEPNPKPPI